MNYQTALKILGLPDPPTPTEIKKNFRVLALRFHPDRNPDNPQAVSHFQECASAYNFLLEHRERWFPGAGSSAAEQSSIVIEDLTDIFDDIFGFTRDDRILGIQTPQTMNLSPAELAFGAAKEVKTEGFEKCPSCHGSGSAEGFHAVICTHCFGGGRIRVAGGEGEHSFKICPRCEGRGRGLKRRCSDCDGFGRLRKLTRQLVEIPVGLLPGEVYTVCSTDQKSKKKFSLFVRPCLLTGNLFAVDKSDIVCDYPVDQKILDHGGELDIPTPWGFASVKLPPQSREGETKVLEGFGFYKNSLREKRGDMKIVLKASSRRQARKGQKNLLKIMTEGNPSYGQGKKSWWKKIFGLTVVFLLITSCATLGLKKKATYPAEVNEAMQSAFNEAEALYKSKEYDQALSLYQNYLTSFAYNKLADEALYKIGKIFFIKKERANAILKFEELAQKTPDPAWQAKAYYMAGYTAMTGEDWEKAQSSFGRVAESFLSAKFKIHYYSLKIELGQKRGLSQSDLDYYFLRLVDTYQENPDLERADLEVPHLISSEQASQRLRSFVTSPLSADSLPNWFSDYPEGFCRPYVDYKWGKVSYEAGRTREARKKLSRFVHAYPKHEYTESAKKILRALGGETPVDLGEGKEIKIGVVLPLTGPQETYGRAILWGIECAVGNHEGCEEAPYTISGDGQRVSLLVKNSGSTPDEVTAMVDELVSADVSAIIGPISGPLAEAAAKRAQEHKVVLLPITQKTGIMGVGDYIFQMGYTSNQQIEDLVKKARDRGIRSFGVFYPNISYGQEMAELFSTAVRASGGRVVVKASYDPGSADMQDQARRLKTGLTRFSEGSGKAGFGALFIPDSYRSVNRVAEGLQFVSVEGIPLLGTNAWNDARLALTSAESYPGSFFMDVFFAGSEDPTTVKFASAYRQAFGRSPTSLEALGFDAVRFVQQAIETAGNLKSSKIREALSSMTSLQGVTRIRSFTSGSGPVVEPYMLGVGADGIRQSR